MPRTPPTPQALAQPLTPAETAALQGILLQLLAGRIQAFTGGGSSSIPLETAAELLQSLAVTLQVENPAQARALLHTDPNAALLAGQARLRSRWALAGQLCRMARRTAPPWQNLALRETLESIAATHRNYRPEFFAHELPCSIDYPLCDPVPETLQGPDYLVEYLKRLLAEYRLMAALPAPAARAVLCAAYPDCHNQVVNVCEPLAANLLGRALLGLPVAPLLLPAAALPTLAAHLRQCPSLPAALQAAAQTAAGELHTPPGPLLAVAAALPARLAPAARRGDFTGVFVWG